VWYGLPSTETQDEDECRELIRKLTNTGGGPCGIMWSPRDIIFPVERVVPTLCLKVVME
jgi:hypothetical protein